MPLAIGCAGWSLPREQWARFPSAGSHLERYATALGVVELNSSFYRPHRESTYARWAASVPPGFRFSVKLPRTITHQCRLEHCEEPLARFLAECSALGERLGCLLVQLPPSLDYEPRVAQAFFERLRRSFKGLVAIEPRHSGWLAAEALLADQHVARVAADPPRFGADALPGGWTGFRYWRLHGAPKLYYSTYSEQALAVLAAQMRATEPPGVDTWCIFDNTAAGAAVGNALRLKELAAKQMDH